MTPARAGTRHDLRPNVLVVMTDQQQAASLGCYGNDVARTPAIDALAAGGVVSDLAFCSYPACTPARAAFHTGRYPHTTRVRANHIHLPSYEITLPMVLRAAGYETALFGKNHVFADGSPRSQFRTGALALRDWPASSGDLAAMSLSEEPSLADERHLFDVWSGANHFGPDGPEFAALRAFSLEPWLWRSAAASAVTPFPMRETTSAVLGDRASAFIRDRAQRDRPWFAWLSFPDPHNPYQAPQELVDLFDPGKVELPAYDDLTSKPERQRIASRMCGMHEPDEDALRRTLAIQHAQVAGVDDAVGKVLQALRESDQERSTLVVYLTDHGGYLGEHGAWHKALAFYDCLVRIPLILAWPGTIDSARLDDGFVEQIDLMPTILDLVDIDCPPGVQGRSIASRLSEPRSLQRPLRDAAFAEAGEGGEPVTWDDLPFMPDSPLDGRYFPWDGFQEAWVGPGKMVRTTRWKYAWYLNGDEELYDLETDPDELVNLAGEEGHGAKTRELRDRILHWTVENEDPLPVHAGNIYLQDVVAGRLPF